MLEGLRITAVALTNDAAIDILETVLDAGHTHGLGYWGRVSNVRTREGRVVAFTVTEHEPYSDQEEARTCKVNTAEIRAAVQGMLRDPKGTESDGWTGRLLDDQGIDGPLADAIVQVACFGKVLYG